LTASTGLCSVVAGLQDRTLSAVFDRPEGVAWLLLYIKVTPVNIATRACQDITRFRVGSTVGLVQFLIF